MLKNQKEFHRTSTPKSNVLRQHETIEQLTKQLAKGGFVAFGGNMIGKVLAFGLSILFGRVLGPAAYGLLALGRSIIGLAQTIASLGLSGGVVRFCALYKGEGDRARIKGIILTALCISAICSVLISAILFVFATVIAQRFFNEPDLTWVIRILSLSLPFYVVTGVAGAFALSFRRVEYQMMAANVFRPLATLSLVGLAFLLGFRLAGAIYAILISAISGSVLSLYYLWKIFPEITSSLRPVFNVAKSLILFSLPMIFITMSYFLALKTDRIMLGLLRDTTEVGIYSAASNIALQFGVIHAALVSIFMPVISDVYNKQDLYRVKELYHLVKRWSSYCTFLIVIPVIFFSRQIISIYGNEFAQAWPALIVLPAAYLVSSIAGPTGALLQMTGRQNIEFFNGFIMIVTNVFLNYLLIPQYGYLGAAFATLLATSIMNFIQVLEIRRFFGFQPFNIAHLKFITLGIFVFLAGTAVSIFLTGGIKLFFFVVLTSIFVIYGYKNKTDSDIAVWSAFKKKLSAVKIR